VFECSVRVIFVIDHYVSQAAWEVEDKRPSENWPEKGEVKFVDYGTRYREGLDLVIKGIDCTVKPGEKVSCYIT
jgi:ABC-type multidrug transport system fused ATPase/permease subunit